MRLRELRVIRSASCLLLLLLWAAGLEAQLLPRCEGARLKTMYYTNSGGEKGRTTFFYGRDGMLRSALWSLDDGSRCSANYHLYDGAGRVTEKYREFSDGLTSTERYEYDGEGRRIRERFSRSDGVSGEAGFSWDGEGRRSSAVCRNFRGWFTGDIAYGYGEGRLNRAVITREGREIGLIEYRYGAGGCLQSETWRFGEQWSQTFRYEWETVPGVVWSAANPLQMENTRYRTRSETYDYCGRGGGPSTYRYDASGRLAEKVFERADGLTTVTTYGFDDKGSLVSSHRTYSTGLTADFGYRYDGALRLVEKTFRRSDGAAGHERYRYDRLGRLTGIDYRNMDFWLNGTITFERDRRGRLASGRFEAGDGNDATIELATDDQGNVTRLDWVFDDGTTQTYRFVYEPAGGSPPVRGHASPQPEG